MMTEIYVHSNLVSLCMLLIQVPVCYSDCTIYVVIIIMVCAIVVVIVTPCQLFMPFSCCQMPGWIQPSSETGLPWPLARASLC